MRYFNPRPPCGGRPDAADLFIPFSVFQSTPLVRGATCPAQRKRTSTNDFNPRPPCGGRLIVRLKLRVSPLISIHAPRVGGDSLPVFWPFGCCGFQSTPPVWGATQSRCCALWGGTFQSTPPVWGATTSSISTSCPFIFQSTPPMRGATVDILPQIFRA